MTAGLAEPAARAPPGSDRSPERGIERLGSASYATKKRMYSFIHQIHEVQRAAPATVLEVGVGNHFVSRYLSLYYGVTTVDIDRALGPSCVGTVEKMPFVDDSFDVALCCQVLEHLPFERFAPSLREIRRVAKRLVLSVPDCAPAIPVELPRFGRRVLALPWRRPVESSVGDHYWEVNRPGFPTKRVLATIRESGWDVESHHQLFENWKHHFFILERA